MPATIDFLFDFGSPNGYLAWKVLPQIAERTGAGINLIPALQTDQQPLAGGGLRPGEGQAGLRGR
jgi:2-hydroxychromene-2-carboxylate isomerase